MIGSKKLYGAIAATFIVAACQAAQTYSSEEYNKLPAVEVYESGIYTSVYLKTRPLVRQRFLLSGPKNPKAVVIFFKGGAGAGYGHGSLSEILEHVLSGNGIGFALVNPPSDFPNGFCCGFRSSADHVEDVDAVIRYVKKVTGRPIWLAGHSTGAVSVANVAINTTERIDGVIFSAADLLRSGNYGEPSVTHMRVRKIKVPVLTIAHKLDACRLGHGGSVPKAAAKIVKMAENAPVKEAVLIEGGVGSNGNPCTSGYHMYNLAGSRFADAVANFVLRNTNTRAEK